MSFTGVDDEDPTRTTIHHFATVVVKATPKPRNPESEPSVKNGDKKEAADDHDDDDGGGSVESASTKKSDKPKEGSKNGSKAVKVMPEARPAKGLPVCIAYTTNMPQHNKQHAHKY